jgi:hypothetical protein
MDRAPQSAIKSVLWSVSRKGHAPESIFGRIFYGGPEATSPENALDTVHRREISMHVREPTVQPVAVKSLRPTQMTVGMREVNEKRRRWREHKGKKKAEFLGRHMIPVIRGPKDRLYVVDHHHLARALHDEGQTDVVVSVIADLRALDRSAFWCVLDNRAWCHPYDQHGVRCGFDDIPDSISGLRDDPFRSLAGELRRLGGYSKETVPFSEFLWADFLRCRLKRKAVEEDFGDALEKALRLAKSSEANYLPGWCGPVTDDT